jgi:hypothetical protein
MLHDAAHQAAVIGAAAPAAAHASCRRDPMLRHSLPQLRDLPPPLQQCHLRRLDCFFNLAGRG